MLTNGWRSQTQQTSKYTSLLSAIVFVHNKSLYTCTCTYTHAHSHNHTRLFHMSILHFWSHHLLQSIYSLYVNISQNTATWIMPGSSQKAFTPEKQACQTLKYSSLFFFFSLHHKVFGWWSTLWLLIYSTLAQSAGTNVCKSKACSTKERERAVGGSAGR